MKYLPPICLSLLLIPASGARAEQDIDDAVRLSLTDDPLIAAKPWHAHRRCRTTPSHAVSYPTRS